MSGGSSNGISFGEGARLSDDELRRRKALIPNDTRDFTGRVMGDPIPGDARWAEPFEDGSAETYHPLSAIPDARSRGRREGTFGKTERRAP